MRDEKKQKLPHIHLNGMTSDEIADIQQSINESTFDGNEK